VAAFLVLAPLAVANDVKVVSTGKLCSRDPCLDDGPSTIGAEIQGISDFSSLEDSDIIKIRGALADHGVVYFHGAGHLFTPEVQLEFAERFGNVLPEISRVPQYVEKGVHQSTHSVRNDDRTGMDVTVSVNTMVEANKLENKVYQGKEMPNCVARLVREPSDPFSFGEGYHADVTFFQEPPRFTFLVAREMPGGMDDTHFIDVSKAYNSMPEDLKQEITGLSAYHNDSAGIVHRHPVVRTHPETGKQSVYVNSHFTHHVEGYGAEEGAALLEKVFDHVELEQPIFHFKWTCEKTYAECGSKCPECMHALLWDNRWLQHTATTKWAKDPVLGKRRRELHRVTISGSGAPFYRPIPSQSCSSDTCRQ